MADSCGNPNVEPDALMLKKAKFDRSTNCVKCKTERGKLVVRHAVYCRDCFESLLLARFRKAFEPHINHVSSGTRRSALRPSGDLLLGLSGGVGSSVLLDVVHRTYVARTAVEEGLKGGREHPRKDKVWQTIRGAYVEVCGAFPGMVDRTEKVRDAVARYEGIEFIPLRLEDAFDPVWWARIDQTPLADIFVDLSTDELNASPTISTSPSTPLDSLRDYLSRLPTSTAVLSAVAKLVRVLLLYTVRATRSSHLLLGTSLTSLSISLISSISQGAGFNVPQTIQEEWRPPGVSVSDEKKRPWQGEVRVIRPLRDVGMKECAVWAWWNRLTVVRKEQLPITAQTISSLTKNFIVGLEKDFPSTVSTVSKTAAKLAPKGSAGDPCILCELPVQRGVQEWKARISIRTRSADGPLAASTAAPSVALAPLFCYACHTMLISRSSRGTVPTKGSSAPAPPPIVPLPVWSSAALSRSRSGGKAEVYTEQADDDGRVNGEVWQTRKLRERDMRAAVGDFLLDE